MTAWESLAEARIREWTERQKSERESKPAPAAAVPRLELQLFDEITRLHADAAAARDPAQAEALRRTAAALETRLLIVLEKSGRPLEPERSSGEERSDEEGRRDGAPIQESPAFRGVVAGAQGRAKAV